MEMSVKIDFDNVRERLRLVIENYYNRLGISFTQKQQQYLRKINNLKIIECGHGWFFPILGIYRMPLMAANLIHDDNTVVIFRCNDDYTRRTHYSTRKLGFSFRGKLEEEQQNPITVSCKRKRILRYSPPPSESELIKLSERMKGIFLLNAAYMREQHNHTISRDKKREACNRIGYITNFLIERLKHVDNYADWCAKIHINLMKLTNSAQYEKIFFVSNIDISMAFKDILLDFTDKSEQYVKIISKKGGHKDMQNRLYKESIERNYLPLWFICPYCLTQNRGIKKGDGFFFRCEHCKKTTILDINKNLVTVLPDVVTKYILKASIKPYMQVIGKMHDYLYTADSYIKEIYGWSPPKRCILKSRVMFSGIGDPKEGTPNATLIRALTEIDVKKIGKLVIGDWNKDLRIKSEQ